MNPMIFHNSDRKILTSVIRVMSESKTPPPTSPNNPTGLSGGTYVCEICNIGYRSKEDLEKHNGLSHPDRKIEQL